MEGVLLDSSRAFVEITQKIYVVNNLKVGILIGLDIVILE